VPSFNISFSAASDGVADAASFCEVWLPLGNGLCGPWAPAFAHTTALVIKSEMVGMYLSGFMAGLPGLHVGQQIFFQSRVYHGNKAMGETPIQKPRPNLPPNLILM